MRVRVRNKLCFVTIEHEGKQGNAAHRKLTFATRHAFCDLKRRVDQGQVSP